MGKIKDKNSKDLTEAEEIEMRWQEYKEEMQRALEDKFDELFGGIEHPVRHKIKRFFKKLFSKKKKRR